ncbi:MAG TPA: NAD(P)H-dependent glycerol-3-phosphate dehydrogenase [Opitutaceae bacterium]|nr:NAD(P)H-dependent glycerol-3-phosphate dehydrogenase [Opitutaceae bacterium]
MNVCVIGAGAWGTAFALHLLRLGHAVTLVPRRFEQAVMLASAHENADYLPGVPLPASLQIGHELGPVLMAAEVVVLASPAQALRWWCERIGENLGQATQLQMIISLAKGLEVATHLRPSQVIRTVLAAYPAGALAGPTTAAEVARGQPAAMVLAADPLSPFAQQLQAAVSGPSLRVYTSDDLAGVEYGGGLKNIYAIAAGCCDGLRLGDNAKASLLTRALAEMVRVGVSLGAQTETFYGLSGAGDLMATCYGDWSRNHEFGRRLGEGCAAGELLGGRRTVVEGYRTTESFHGLCAERGISAPILAEVHGILFGDRKPAEALRALMTRELKPE